MDLIDILETFELSISLEKSRGGVHPRQIFPYLTIQLFN